MQTLSTPLKIFLWLILLACMYILTKNILFKHNKDYSIADAKKAFTSKGVKKRLATANLQPFTTIKLFYNSRRLGTGYKVGNLVGNVVGFIPLGILFPLLFGWKRGYKAIIAVFLVSLGFELSQLFFALGVFDVDDLILNTAGGMIGYLLYWMVRSFVRHNREQKQVDAIAAE